MDWEGHETSELLFPVSSQLIVSSLLLSTLAKSADCELVAEPRVLGLLKSRLRP